MNGHARNMWQSRKLRQVGLQVALYLLLALPALAALMPFLWVASTSLKTPHEIFVLPIRWIPKAPHLRNYVEIFRWGPFHRYLLNTVLIAGLATLGTELSCLAVGYSLAHLRWRGREVVFGLVLATMMLPGIVTLVPRYVLFFKMKWVGTYLPLIVPDWFGSAFYIFLFRQFLRSLPIEIDESARLDGATSLRILGQIIAPLSKPAITSVAIFAFLNHYNEFMGPLLYITKRIDLTIQLGLYQFVCYSSGADLFWHLQMAASIVAIAPLIILFFVAQKQFIRGVAFTGLSGR